MSTLSFSPPSALPLSLPFLSALPSAPAPIIITIIIIIIVFLTCRPSVYSAGRRNAVSNRSPILLGALCLSWDGGLWWACSRPLFDGTSSPQ